MQTYSIIGKRIPLIDAAEKATGHAVFTGDIALPNMLYAGILRSPYAHARIIRVDTTRAEKLPGVKAVLSKNNAPRNKVPFSFALPSDKIAFDYTVRFIGDEVAAVAAVSNEIAEEALRLIKVTFEELPAVCDANEAMKPGAPLVHEEKPGNIATEKVIEFGNIEKGFKEADYIFEDTFTTSSQRHASMETHSCCASFERTGKLTVWTATQLPCQLQEQLADYLNMPMSKVRVIKPHVGGGFGSKLDMIVQHICALLAKMTGQPVRLVLDRKEEFSATVSQHAYTITLKMGVKKDGSITAIKGIGIGNVGAYMYKGEIVIPITGSALVRVYRCENVRYEGYGIYTNTMPAGALRGFGNPPGYFALESLVDTICDKLAIDPLDFRIDNYKVVGERGRAGNTITSSGFNECISRGAQLIGWDRRKEIRTSEATKKRGIGMASIVHGSGARPMQPDFSSAFVKMNEDGSAHIFTTTADLGTGSDTTLSQIAAEELGLDMDDVAITSGDTDAGPFDEGAYASRTVHVSGGAVKAAATDVKCQLLSYAATKLGVQPDELSMNDKKIYVRVNPSRAINVASIVREARKAKEGAKTFIGNSSYEDPFSAQTFAAHFAEVEVDTETGQVEVLKIVAVHDVGKAINPAIVEGQIAGGVAQGIGYALVENPVINKNTGEMLNPNFANYMVMTALDIPQIIADFVEPVDPTGPFGAKGVGEPPLEAVAPAIANAIYNATGIRITEIPITPELIFSKLNKTLKNK